MMELTDDGRGRALSPLRCVVCQGYDAHREDRFIAIEGRAQPSRQELIEKATTAAAMADELLSASLPEYRTSKDPHKLAAASFIDRKIRSILEGDTASRLREENGKARMRRICFPCWSAQVTRSN